MNLIEHIEHHLGAIQEGWSKDIGGSELPFQVVRTSRGPIEGTAAYLTLGLSNTVLPSPRTKKLIRQELVMVSRSQPTVGIPGILQQVGGEVVASCLPILRGSVIGPRGSLFPGSEMRALYAAIPVYFPDAFASCEVDGLGPVVFTWLVPVSRQEADFVVHCGWERFEDRLVEENPDLADVFRKPMNMLN